MSTKNNRFLDTEHKRKSMIITVSLHVLLIIVLLFAGMKYMDPPIMQGIAINFGTSDTGMGDVQPLDKLESAPQPSTATTNTASPEVKDEVVTQDVVDAPVIKEKIDKKPTESTILDKKEETKKPDPKPDKATTDALTNILQGTKNDGTAKGGEGNDHTPGDKGSPDGDPNATSYYGSGKGLDGDGNYQLGGRRALNKERFIQECNEAGTVVVSIEVDRNGKVINATPGVRGTTNTAPCLMEPARRAALATKFNPDEKAPTKQVGKIIYRFSLSD